MKKKPIDAQNSAEPAEALIFISAGEPSGDLAGGHLLQALKNHGLGSHNIMGIGGSRMVKEGLASLFPMAELSVMGFVEVLPRLWRLKKRLQQTFDAIVARQPHAVVTIDSPGFHFALARRLKADPRTRSIPIIHYVAPSVWAWRAGRARKIAGFLDHLLVLFPFEPQYFEKYGLPTTCVGHFATERELPKLGTSEAKFRQAHKLSSEAPVLCLLPGSRVREVRTLLPIFLEAAKRLQQKHPTLEVVIPTLDHLKATVEQITAGRAQYHNEQGHTPRILVGDDAKWACFEHSTAALAASGTVTLELAQAGTPTVVGYKVNPLTAWIVRRFLTIPFVGLVNIIMKRRVVPELLQERCCPQCISEVMSYVLFDEPTRQVQKEAFAKVVKMIRQPGGHSASAAAAAVVMSYVSKRLKREGTGPAGKEQSLRAQ